MKTKFSPFQKKADVDCVTTLKTTFGIGIQDYDRGHDVWDPDFVNEAGVVEPSWVHVPSTSREVVVTFSTNTGQGSGRQIIPADEFDEYVKVLENIIASGYNVENKVERTEYVPTYTVARQSFQMVRPKTEVTDKNGKTKFVSDQSAAPSIVSVRTKNGQGQKPINVPVDQFESVVEVLRNVADNIAEYKSQAWAAFNAESEPESGSDT